MTPYDRMLLDVESIVEGTWSSEAEEVPPEFQDFFLMEGMGWSWEELNRTPPYVRRFCGDFISIRAKVQHEKAERERKDAERHRQQF